MNSKIKIFSSSLLGCQRKALETHAMTLKKPLQLFKTIKNMIASVLFERYKVVIIDSEDLFTTPSVIPERLELMSPGKTAKTLKNYVIEVQNDNLIKTNVSLFTDVKGNIYQGKFNKKDHAFHITNLISIPNTHTSSLDINHSNGNNSNDKKALSNDRDTDNIHRQTATEPFPENPKINSVNLHGSNSNNNHITIDPRYDTVSAFKDNDVKKEVIIPTHLLDPFQKKDATTVDKKNTIRSKDTNSTESDPTTKREKKNQKTEELLEDKPQKYALENAKENDKTALNNDITADKTNKKKQTETLYVTEKNSNPTDRHPAIDTRNDTENIQKIEEKHVIFEKELKVFETELENTKKEERRLLNERKNDKKPEYKQQEISDLNNKRKKVKKENWGINTKINTKINPNFRNAFKKTPEIYEIAEVQYLFKSVTDEIITKLEKDFEANPAASPSDLRQVLIYHYGAIIDNSNKENTRRLGNLVYKLEESLRKSNHDWNFEILPMKLSVSAEMVHGYLIHNPELLKNRLTSYYRTRDNPATPKEEHQEPSNEMLRNILKSLEPMITDNNYERKSLINSNGDYTSTPSRRIFQWHYEFAKMNESCGGHGFSDILLLNSKDEILGKENWEQFKKLSKEMKNFNTSEFKEETQSLTKMMSSEIGKPVSLDLQYINDKIEQLELANNNKEQAQLSRLKDYKEKLILIADAKHMFFCFEQNFYHAWDISILLNHKLWGSTVQDTSLYTCFKKMSELDQLKDPIINEMQLSWMVNSHNNSAAKKDMAVCIEGAGPAGLMSAFSQYKVGANVTLIEKRNTDYNRVQIVRLDPKTMSWLKFHMPQGYSELFPQTQEEMDAVSHTRFGLIKSDGFGLIAINEVEDKLHKQLTKLSSLSKDENGKEELERFAMMEIIEVMVDDKEESFCLIKQSPFELDKDTVELHKQDEEVTFHKIKFDILICAGGKTSTVGRHLNPVPVTNTKHYGVCTWDIKETEETKNNEQNEFGDFRNVLPLDKLLENKLNQQFNEQLSEEQQKTIFASEEPLINLRPIIKKIDKITSQWIDGKKIDTEHVTNEETTLGELLINKIKITLDDSRSKVLQTRLFENNNRFYIGMEIPSGYDNWIETTLKNTPSEQKGIAKQMLIKCWYQAVASVYGLDNCGAMADRINTQFSSRFPLQQSRVTKNPVQLGNGLIIAVGDASCTPHFMTASGLTSVRAGVDNAEKLTKSIVENSSNTADASDQKPSIETSKRYYINRQCALEEEVINRGLRLLGDNNIQGDNGTRYPKIILSARVSQLQKDVSDRTKEKGEEDYKALLIEKYHTKLDEMKCIQSDLILEKKKFEEKIESLKQKKEEMQDFLLKRHQQVKDKPGDFMRSFNFNKSKKNENTETISSSNIENEKFIKVINNAEMITDNVIKSLMTKYIDTMQENEYCRIENTQELPHLLNMKDNADLKALQRSKLFDAIKLSVIQEQDKTINEFNKSNKSLIDHGVAKRNLSELKGLINVFFPNKQHNKSFLIDVNMLEQNGDFDEMADHLFEARWARKSEKTSIVSLFKDEKKSADLSKIDQMIEKTKLFELSSLSRKNSHELNTILTYLDGITEEAKEISAKVHQKSVTTPLELECQKKVISNIEETVRQLKSSRVLFLNGIQDAVRNISPNVSKQFNLEQLTEELNLLTSTIANLVKKRTDDIINEQTTHLEKKLELKPESCRELIRKQMFDTNLLDIKDKESAGTLQKIKIDVWDELCNKSPFWNDYFTRMNELYSQNKNLANKDYDSDLQEFQSVSNYCLMLIHFHVQAELGLDKHQVFIQEDVSDFIDWNKNKKRGNANQLKCILIPAIADNEKNIIIKGLGLIELGKKFNFDREAE